MENTAKPRVSAELLSRSRLLTRSLEGNETPLLYWCSYHKGYHHPDHFFIESKNHGKMNRPVRYMCKEGWTEGGNKNKKGFKMTETPPEDYTGGVLPFA